MKSLLLASLFVLMSGLVTSQVAPELKERLDFYLAEISTEKRADKNFRKAYHFFIKEEHDSTIVYSGRYLKSKEKYSPLVSFALYFRGRSFSFKGLNKQSKNDLMRINSSFPLYNSVKVEIGNAHFKDQNYSKALEIYLEVSNDGDFQKKGVLESALNNNIGLSFMLSNDLVKAEEYLLLSLDQMKGSNDTSRIVDGYISVANLYYEQYLDDQAIEYFQKAYDLASETRDYPLRMTATLNMAVVEENRGDFEKSLAYRKEYDQWKDSTNNQEKVWEIAQIEKRHLAETKQKEIALLQNKKRLAERESNLKSQERNAILIGAGVLLAVLVLIIYFYYQKIRSSAIIAEQRESLDRLNGFKNRLFSIVSHDLRSSVHGLRRSTEQLRAEIPEEDSRLKSLVNQQGAIANSTYGMLDNLLNWALLQSDEIYFHPEKISLKRLIPQVVMNYQPLLDQKNISLAIDIPVEAKILADNDSVKIVLRNVLDNAMKFTPEKGVLKISAIVEEECVELRIKDNGPGMAPEQLTKVIEQSARVSKESGAERSGTGLGVRLCASFMSKNNGSFHIESEVDEGTTVILRFEKS